ncbi:MAG: hypothetical protein D6730_07250 [Bacteroidetes bacterium]|nr:MAG: hypothetical protein D6730_07250 [Bacteroidota bacterium]
MIMKVLNFGDLDSIPTHACEAHRSGDWIVFRCAECPDYERRINWRTGEVKVRNSSEVLHSGTYLPYQLERVSCN